MLLLVFGLMNILIIGHLRQLFQYVDIVAAAYGKGEIAENSLAQIIRENETNKMFSDAALWKAEGKVPVNSEGTGREQIVSLYQVKGQQKAVFGRGLEEGRYFTEGELNVCLADRETVRALFGSDHVLGMKIGWEDTEFEIVGILEGKQPLCIIPAREGTAYDGIAAKKAEKTSSSEIAFSTLETSLGGVGQQRIDGHLYYMTACLIYFLLLVFFMIVAGVKAGRRRIITVLFMLLAAEILIMGIGFASPGSDYLPSFWSDFGFYAQCLKEKSHQIEALLHHQEFVSWQQMFGGWLHTMIMELAEGIFGIYYITGVCARD